MWNLFKDNKLREQSRIGIVIVNFEQISHIAPVFPLYLEQVNIW